MNERSIYLPVRRFLKDLYWTWRGLPLKSRPVPPGARTLLFVCKGNICRSPFAERLTRRFLAERGRPDIRCLSAGFLASPDERSPREAMSEGRARGIPLDDHRPTPMSDAIVSESDVIVVMEAEHVEDMRRRFPAALDRVILLPLVNASKHPWGYHRYNIADPFGKDEEAFRVCYDIITRHATAFADEVARG